MNAFSKLALAAAITLSSGPLAFAQQTDHNAHHAASSTAANNSADAGQKGGGVAGQMVEGEIKKVNKEAGKLTIRHGELKDLGMPAMTMVFHVKDPAMLDQVKAGDKIKFVAQKVEGAMTVVKLENVK